MVSGTITKYMDGEDSGWLELRNADVYSGIIRCRKIGNLVEVTATAIQLAADLTGNEVTLKTLPSGY